MVSLFTFTTISYNKLFSLVNVSKEQLIYLNACIIAAKVNSTRLQELAKQFSNDWIAAWQKIKISSLNPEKEWVRVERADLQLIPKNDPAYPPRLKHIAGAPLALYLKGDKAILRIDRCLAVVGSRALSEYGRRAAYQLAGELAAAGFTIVSGLAMGVDGVAHQATVDRKGKTIAVLGGPVTGTSIVSANAGLAQQIIKCGGALISELPLTMGAHKGTFPERNRIVSGIARGTIVIEAGPQSGALITARLAAEQGRDVFALPGPIYSRVSRGTNGLIKQGAKIVTTVADILAEYPELAQLQTRLKLTSEHPVEATILRLLTETPLSLNELVRLSNLAAPTVTASLMNLELNDKVINLGGNKYAVRT